MVDARQQQHEKWLRLVSELDAARKRYFAHIHPGNLTDIELHSWEHEEEGLFMLMQAAQMRVDAEEKVQKLLAEAARADG